MLIPLRIVPPCVNSIGVSINLTEHERGAPFTGDFAAALNAVQERLARGQLSQIVHGRRAIIIVEGWEGAGKKQMLRHLVGSWDPCQLSTHCVGAEEQVDHDRHWLARFWAKIPPAGHTSIFYRSWYRQMVEERLAGDMNDIDWARATDEVNEFESQQRDHGTLIVKLFFHLSAQKQAERLSARREDEWRRWLVGPGEVRSLTHRAEYEAAFSDVFAQTDTRWAPWKIIDGCDERSGCLAALEAIAAAYARTMPEEPPVDGESVVQFDRHKRA